MPIHKKDRSFDKIFEQVSLDTIPMDYVQAVRVNLMDGSILELDKSQIQGLSSEKEIIQTLKRNDITDVQISLDYESIKSDVSNNVKKLLQQHF